MRAIITNKFEIVSSLLSAYMFRICILLAASQVLHAALFDDFDGDDPTLLNCNWAQSYNDFDLLINCEEMQEEVMLLASHWEGKFAAVGVAPFADSMTLDWTIDRVTGNLKAIACKSTSIGNEGLHLTILAMALNGSRYADTFVRASIPKNWNGTVTSYIFDLLSAKMTIYENHDAQVPGLGGLFSYIHIYPNATFAEYDELTPYDGAYFVWPMLAVYQTLLDYSGRDADIARELSKRYKRHVDTIAENFLKLFHDSKDGGLWWSVSIADLHIHPTPENSVPHTEGGHFDLPFDYELAVMFADLYANWTNFGGDTAKAKMWSYIIAKMAKVNYSIDDDKNIDVELGYIFAPRERLQYLYLPYFDVPIDEKIFINGEIARTHYSAVHKIPGLFSPTYKYTAGYDWNYVDLGIQQSKSRLQELAMKPLGNITYDTVNPSAAFPLLLHPALRKFGLVWYLATLRKNGMQGPYGSLCGAQTNGPDYFPVMQWPEKLPPILAFDGGVVRIIKQYLQNTGKYEKFCQIVEGHRRDVFDGSPLTDINRGVYLPTKRLDPIGARFFLCSNKNYSQSQPKCSRQHEKKIPVPYEIIGIICGAVIILILTMTCVCNLLKKQRKNNLKKFVDNQIAGSTESRSRPDDDGDWEVDPSNLIVEEEIGAGAFAMVCKGKLQETPTCYRSRLHFANDNIAADGSIIVAVKTPTTLSSDSQITDFLDEIVFMKNLGYHLHLVNLVGCVSDRAQPMLLLEYCRNGDLLHFLQQRNRTLPSYTIHPEDQIHEATMEIRYADLMLLAWQINDGMIYLSSRKHIHRDLAARNVLLTETMVAKISDFGLCRTPVKDEYMSKGGLLPLRWMAPESMQRMEFTTKSDVWSYAVLLYELFSFGDTPYISMQKSEILDFLRSGKRLPQPQVATEKIYDLMQQCWHIDPKQRPTFEKIGDILRSAINDKNGGEYLRTYEHL